MTYSGLISLFMFLFACLGGYLYNLGGIGGGPWYYDTKMRDLGVPLVATATIILLLNIRATWWVHLISFGMMFGSMTTYCKIGKQKDVYWWNWLLTGLLYGFTAILYAWLGSAHWLGFLIRTVFLGVTVCVWSELVGDARKEEFGRGFLFIITLPLLLI